MERSLLLATFLTLIYRSLFIVASENRTCLEKYSGIYFSRDENRIVQLTWYSPDGTLFAIDSKQKTGSPTITGRNDRAGRWKCSDPETADILTQSVQVEESKNPTDPLVARLYETGTTCLNNKRTNCSDIIQYRHLNVTISTHPPEQIYNFAENFYSLKGQSLLLPYKGYANQAKQHLKCLTKKSGLYVIEYQKKSGSGLNKTYGLFQLRKDGFFSWLNSDESEGGTHKFGTTLGRWKCTRNSLSATGLYFIYHPKQKLGEVMLHIDQCSSSLTNACMGDVASRQYPLQFHQRPFKNGTPKTMEKITMIKYSSETQTKNKRCYKNFAGTYFILSGGSNNTNEAVVLSGVYRTVQLFRDGRSYLSQVAEILTEQAVGNAVGYWTCDAINSTTTHINIQSVVFSYNTIGRPVQGTATQDFTCDNTPRNCVGQGIGRFYNSQLPYDGQFQQPVATVLIKSILFFYANLPPY